MLEDDVYNTSDPTIPSLVSKFVNFASSFSEGHVHILLIFHKAVTWNLYTMEISE
jgi:hypothetical protein